MRNTNPCEDCPYCDPKMEYIPPHIDSDGKVHDKGEVNIKCSHEKACRRIYESKSL